MPLSDTERPAAPGGGGDHSDSAAGACYQVYFMDGTPGGGHIKSGSRINEIFIVQIGALRIYRE